MASAFTAEEKAVIVEQLKRTARQYAAMVGMRHTTVEQLAAAADISKGAFYKFYPSKEHLFFDVMEDLHTEVYQSAAQVLQRYGDLPPAGQAAAAVLTACRTLEASGMTRFMERDVPYLLRKIPPEIRETHYHSDEVHIQQLLKAAGLFPKGGYPLAAATVRGLMLTVSHRDEIGEHYAAVLETMVRGTCEQLFS